jgi:hypothetical protein
MATVAEAEYARSLQARRAEERFFSLLHSSLQQKATPVTGKLRKVLRRRLVVWISHAFITLGAPESLGTTLLIGLLVDMFRLVLTWAGPAVGIKGGWTELFVVKFWDGDLLDKTDALFVAVEFMAAVIALLFLIVLLGLIAQQIGDNPLANIFMSSQ